MLRVRRKRLESLDAHELLAVIESLCFGDVIAEPIYECVKVFVRVLEDGNMTFARHSSDLGTARVMKEDVVSRFKDDEVRNSVLEALELVEENCKDIWPFSPGSSSWVLLEILDKPIKLNGPINPPKIVFRRAVRLSSLNKELPISSTPLVERMFKNIQQGLPGNLGRFKVEFSPTIRLKNIAGSGLVTELSEMLHTKTSHQREPRG